MKNKISILILTIFLSFGCSNQNDDIEKEESEISGSIIGKWVIFERCSFEAFSPTTCQEVDEENQYFYEFKEDNSFVSDRFIEGCNNGIYNLEEDSLYIELDCNNFTIQVFNLTNLELHLQTLGDDGGSTLKYKRSEGNN